VPETTFTTWFFAPSGGRKVGKTKNVDPSSQNSPERFNNNSAQQCVLQQKRATTCFFSSLGLAIERTTK